MTQVSPEGKGKQGEGLEFKTRRPETGLGEVEVAEGEAGTRTGAAGGKG